MIEEINPFLLSLFIFLLSLSTPPRLDGFMKPWRRFPAQRNGQGMPVGSSLRCVFPFAFWEPGFSGRDGER